MVVLGGAAYRDDVPVGRTWVGATRARRLQAALPNGPAA